MIIIELTVAKCHTLIGRQKRKMETWLALLTEHRMIDQNPARSSLELTEGCDPALLRRQVATLNGESAKQAMTDVPAWLEMMPGGLDGNARIWWGLVEGVAGWN